MTRTAFITGITGQDGAYLAELLLERGYRVVGGVRRTSGAGLGRLEQLGIVDDVELVPLELGDQASIRRALGRARPDEVYNLAAQSFVAVSFDLPVATGDITGLGAVRVLEAVRECAPDARLYQASTSEMYGGGDGTVALTETSPFSPRSPYAVAKLYAHHMCANAREGHGMHVSSGILFNHESPLRGAEFVTRKVTRAAARIKLGMQRELRVGNLAARRDWGYAREYVDAMHRMLQQDEPGDYVVATGVSYSVRDLVERAFAAVDLDWNDHVIVDEQLLRPLDVDTLVGDATKAREQLGWQPRTNFAELVELMVAADVELAERELRGDASLA
jgi:GDPmannose 4,6-dehydratase